MPIINCPNCQALLSVRSLDAGASEICHHCGRTFTPGAADRATPRAVGNESADGAPFGMPPAPARPGSMMTMPNRAPAPVSPAAPQSAPVVDASAASESASSASNPRAWWAKYADRKAVAAAESASSGMGGGARVSHPSPAQIDFHTHERWVVAHATRPMPGETKCGDRVWVGMRERVLAVAVIDGLGHGPAAAKASDAAVEGLENVFQTGKTQPGRFIEFVHDYIRATRGAAVSILIATDDEIRFGGVGNVECISSLPDFRPFPREGIVGFRYRSTSELATAMQPATLVLHTDGVRRFALDAYAELPADAQPLAIIEAHGRGTDDQGLAIVHLR